MKKNKIAIVTGGNRGIGLSIAQALKRFGYLVAIIHKHDTADVSASGIGEEKIFDFEFIGDVSVEDHVMNFYNQLSEFASDKEAEITVLVNNAGVASAKKFLNLTAQDFKEMLDTNLLGAFHMSRGFLDVCEKGNNHNMLSKIINISSVSGLQGFSGHTHYCASKFALNGMMQVMAKELSKLGVAVNNVCPGPTSGTDMWKKLDEEYRKEGFMPEEAQEDDYQNKLLIKRMGSPADVADAVLYLVCSEYTTGINLPICGGNILR